MLFVESFCRLNCPLPLPPQAVQGSGLPPGMAESGLRAGGSCPTRAPWALGTGADVVLGVCPPQGSRWWRFLCMGLFSLALAAGCLCCVAAVKEAKAQCC